MPAVRHRLHSGAGRWRAFPQKRGFATVIGPAFTLGLADVSCVQCGQCAAVCPVGAIVENNHIDRVWAALEDPQRPWSCRPRRRSARRSASASACRPDAGDRQDVRGVAAARVRNIFDTNFTADLTIIEEGTELLTRLKSALKDGKPVALPQFTSCSPGWIKYMETFYPEYLANLSTCKSPQQMFGAVAKTYWAAKIGKKPEEIYVVSIMPCTAKKFEADRPEMNSSGVRDVDAVLTTRELARMIKQAGIDFYLLADEEADRISGVSSGAADIFANTGGVMEAALRTAYEIVTGRELPFEGCTSTSGRTHRRQGDVVHHRRRGAGVVVPRRRDGKPGRGARSGQRAKSRRGDQVRAKSYHFVEVMTCPGGCIGGGGQPRLTTNEKRKARIGAIYKEDRSKKLRKSHENPKIKQIYGEFLKVPLGEKSHHLLHTKYTVREKI